MEAERRELEFLSTLGSGGFGAVYLANLHGRDRFVRRVAVKVMRDGLDATPDLVARQKDEARLLGLLAHDGIVQVLDLAEVEGRPAVVMEYVEGVDLAELVKNLSPRRVPVRVALELVAGVASALDAAYNSTSAVTGQPLRVIHRDIKPANVLLTVHGRVKVLDFGVAKADFARDGHTTNGGWGTPRFMAPEQWLGESYDAPVDIYALGVTLFDLVADRPWERPPLARTPFEHRVGQHLDSQSDLPDVVLEIIAAMVSFEAADRPTAADVRERCEAALAQVGGDSLARFARLEVPPLVEARSRTHANDPLPGTVTLGGVSSSVTGGRTGPEPSLSRGGVAVPAERSPTVPGTAAPRANGQPLSRWIAAGVVVAGGFVLVVVLAAVGLYRSGAFGAPESSGPRDPSTTSATEASPGAAGAIAPSDHPRAEDAPTAATDPVPSDEAAPDDAAVDDAPVEVVAAVESAGATKTPAKATRGASAARTSPPTAAGTGSGSAATTAAAPSGASGTAAVASTYPLDIVADSIGVAVWVDGARIGATPITGHRLAAGPHTVVVAVGEERSAPYTVVVGADGPARLKYYAAESKWRMSK